MSLNSLFHRELTGYRIARDYYDNILRRLTAQPFPYSTCIYDIQNPVMQSKFHPKKNLLTTVNDKGYVSMYNFDINAFAMSKQFAIHTHAIFDFDWSPTDMDVATASGDSTTKIIRFLDDGMYVERMYFKKHMGTIRSISYRYQDANVVATGGRDGAIMTWDIRVGNDPTNIIQSAHRTNKSRKSISKNSKAVSIISLKFLNENCFFTAGHTGANLCAWDLRKLKQNQEFSNPVYKLSAPDIDYIHGFSDMAVDCHSFKLYANCTNSKIYCFNVLNGSSSEASNVYYGHQNSYDRMIYTKMTLSPDAKYILSGSCDNAAYIWNDQCSKPIISLPGHSTEVNCVAWHPYGEPSLVTISDNEILKYWCIKPEEIDKNRNENGFVEETVNNLNYVPVKDQSIVKKYYQKPCCDLTMRHICTHMPIANRFSIEETMRILIEKTDNNVQNQRQLHGNFQDFIENIPKRENFQSNFNVEHTHPKKKCLKSMTWLDEIRNQLQKRKQIENGSSPENVKRAKKIKHRI